MEDTRDFGIAVAEATRLNDLYRELSEAFAAKPAIEGDEDLWFQHFSTNDASPEGQDWVHRHHSDNVAEITIRRGISDRSLPLWIRLADRDELTDANAIRTIEHRTLTTGVYLTHKRPASYLEGRPLWIKDADWASFLYKVMYERYGLPVATRPTPATRRFQSARDRINSEFARANRWQSANHIKALSEAAEDVAIALISEKSDIQSKELAIDDLHFQFENLANIVRKVAAGEHGRTPKPSNVEIANAFCAAAWDRIKLAYDARATVRGRAADQTFRQEAPGRQASDVTAANTIEKYDDRGRAAWIRSAKMMSADAAHNIYKKLPGYCGTKLLAFRKKWGEIKGTKRGRPRTKS